MTMGHVPHHFAFGLKLGITDKYNGRKKLLGALFTLARLSQRLFGEIGVSFFHLHSFAHPIFIAPHLAHYICFWNMFSGTRVGDIMVINENIRPAWQTEHLLPSKENKSQAFQKAWGREGKFKGTLIHMD